jgi:hypothetical protein
MMSSSVPSSSLSTADLGVAFAPDRAEHNLAVYRTIAEEIAHLREIDLSARHPAVIFDPLRAYACWPAGPSANESTAASRESE